MADIFISYAREDREHAERLAQALAREGFTVWWDIEGLRGGESFNRAIRRALREASCVVVLWSPISVESRYVESEAYWAWKREKLHAVLLDDSLELYPPYSDLHTRSLADWHGEPGMEDFRRLVADLRFRLARVSRDAPKVVTPVPETRGSAERPDIATPVGTDVVPQAEAPMAGAKGPAEPKSVDTSSERGVGNAPETDRVQAELCESSTAEAERKAEREREQAEDSQAQAKNTSNSGGGRRYPWWAVLASALGISPWWAVLASALGIAALVAVLMQMNSRTVEPYQEGQETQAHPQAPAPSVEVPLPEMVTIPADTFRMGCVSGPDCEKDEQPVRAVTFAKPFGIGKYEVTFEEYERFAEATGRDPPRDFGWGRGSRPVVDVSWEDARDYAIWLSAETGKSYRLPTEAEWEYAARAGTDTPWSFGDDASDLGAYAWYSGNSNGQTHPVGEKARNPLGLHDVHGNVWEWVEDCWHESYEGAPDDGGAWLEADGGDCGRRVLRGGSWYNLPENLRSANRDRNNAANRNFNIGFRLAQDL